MKRVRIYTQPGCSLCHSAKATLRSRRIAFREITLAGDARGRAQLLRATGRDVFPQLVVDGRPLGGFDELVSLVHSRRLRDLPREGP